MCTSFHCCSQRRMMSVQLQINRKDIEGNLNRSHRTRLHVQVCIAAMFLVYLDCPVGSFVWTDGWMDD